MRRIVFFTLLFLGQLAIGQVTGSIYGRITDLNADGEPLLFAHVSLKDTQISEQTNFHGNFEINGVQAGSYVLEITYLGYEPKAINIEVNPDNTVLIEESLQTLSLQTENLQLTAASSTGNNTTEKGN